MPDKEYYRKAKKLKRRDHEACRSPARHLDIRAYQDIFTTHIKTCSSIGWRIEESLPTTTAKIRKLCPMVIAR
jgi:hypothetical protein